LAVMTRKAMSSRQRRSIARETAARSRRRRHQRNHHRRVMRRATMAVLTIGAAERRQVKIVDDLQHQPRQLIVSYQSLRLGGNNNSCSRSHAMMFCVIRERS
jgi:hypothetical protein